MYPYTEFPPIDDIMSLRTSTTISWGTNPRITTHKLTKPNYLFFRISCHSIWPISHIHTIPIERCAFLYALITDAPISFPTLFMCSLVEVHRSNARSHGLFFPVFIHRILLDLGLEDFPASKPIHIIAPIGVTFLRQRATQLKASSKRLQVESSTGDASRDAPRGFCGPHCCRGSSTIYIIIFFYVYYAGDVSHHSGGTWIDFVGFAR